MGHVTMSDNLPEVSVYSIQKAGYVGMNNSVSKPHLIWWLRGGLHVGKGRAMHCYEVLSTISLPLPSF